MARKYELRPVIRQPSIIPYTVRGEQAQAFLEEVQARITEEFRGNKNLGVLSLEGKDNILTGSNPLVLPIVARVAQGYRVGRPEDLQRTLNDGDTLSIQGNHYVDMGLVLDFAGSHREMAQDFFDQMPEAQRKAFLEARHPAVVVGYGLKNFDKGSYELGIVHQEGTEVRSSEILSSSRGTFSDKDVSLETGLPARLSGGNRTLYTRKQGTPSRENLGLSRLCLCRNLDVSSDYVYLAYSGSIGRVVLF